MMFWSPTTAMGCPDMGVCGKHTKESTVWAISTYLSMPGNAQLPCGVPMSQIRCQVRNYRSPLYQPSVRCHSRTAMLILVEKPVHFLLERDDGCRAKQQDERKKIQMEWLCNIIERIWSFLPVFEAPGTGALSCMLNEGHALITSTS